MSIWQKITLSLSMLSEGISLLFIMLSAYFFIKYHTDIDGHLSHEAAFGGTLSLLYAAGFAVCGAALAASLRRHLSRKLFKLLTIPALVVFLSFLALYLGSILYGLVART